MSSASSSSSLARCLLQTRKLSLSDSSSCSGVVEGAHGGLGVEGEGVCVCVSE